ncbi:MAG: hypothetical protein K6E59_01145 [Bacilli bacterium]|nr:hypothetical protein [Bacilli bacterium]
MEVDQVYADDFLHYYAKGFYGEMPPLETYADEKRGILYAVLQASKHEDWVKIVSAGASIHTKGAWVEIVITALKSVWEDEEGRRLIKELQEVFLKHKYKFDLFADYRLPFDPDLVPLPEEFKKRFGKVAMSISSPNGGLPVTVKVDDKDIETMDTFIVSPLFLTEEQVKTYEDLRKDNPRMSSLYLVSTLADEEDCLVLK